MNKIFILPAAAFLLSLFLTSTDCNAQQAQATTYTYKVFQAPNKNYGYDIFQNGKIVYHEFASMSQPENTSHPKPSGAFKINSTSAAFNTRENLAFMKSEHAQRAALLAIEKMKRKELPVLSNDEIKTIITQ
jgi:hypothetical protein